MSARVFLDRDDIRALGAFASRPAFATLPHPVRTKVSGYVRALERSGRWGGGDDILDAVEAALADPSPRRRPVWDVTGPDPAVTPDGRVLLIEIRAFLVDHSAEKAAAAAWAFLDELAEPSVALAVVRRPPGRPGWTWELFKNRLEEAEAATSPPKTPQRIADNFALLDGTKGTSSDRVAAIRRQVLEVNDG